MPYCSPYTQKPDCTCNCTKQNRCTKLGPMPMSARIRFWSFNCRVRY